MLDTRDTPLKFEKLGKNSIMDWCQENKHCSETLCLITSCFYLLLVQYLFQMRPEQVLQKLMQNFPTSTAVRKPAESYLFKLVRLYIKTGQ